MTPTYQFPTKPKWFHVSPDGDVGKQARQKVDSEIAFCTNNCQSEWTVQHEVMVNREDIGILQVDVVFSFKLDADYVLFVSKFSGWV